jgi:hypothetical protein
MISKIITKTKNYVGKFQSKMQQHPKSNEQQQVEPIINGQAERANERVVFEVHFDGKPAKGTIRTSGQGEEWDQGDII